MFFVLAQVGLVEIKAHHPFGVLSTFDVMGMQ